MSAAEGNRKLMCSGGGLSTPSTPRLLDAPPAALPVHLPALDSTEAQFFTAPTTLGTPLDVTADELRVAGPRPTSGP